MRKPRISKLLSFTLCVVLIAAMALMISGCNDNTTNDPVSSGASSTVSKTEAAMLGEGDTKFTVAVIDSNGKESVFEVHTNKTTVGEALAEVDLISGEQGPYGLTVLTVNGLTVDYDTDGKYWAFYIDGEYAMAGVDATNITVGATYTFKVE